MEARGVKVSLIAVCHHSSGVLPRCVSSFRNQAEAAGVEPEVVVVEHSEDDDEAAAVAVCGPDRILRRPNKGYAAGLNAGVAVASGDLIFLANPDIEFLDGGVGGLVDAIADGADVAGPQLVWDPACEVVLPIPDDPGPLAELRRTIRRRWPSRSSLEGRMADSFRVWTAEEPCLVPSLRGPLMAVSRESMRRLGPLDEGYFLYYEETEWLWRARRRGARLVLAPRSRVVHRWGHSTRRLGDQARIEERSRNRFFQRNYPAWVRTILGRIPAAEGSRDTGFERVSGPDAIPETPADVWLLSIVSQMEPSVGCLGVSSLPPAARELSSSGRWYAVAGRIEGRRWRLQGRWTWEKPSSNQSL
jgi:N-acetylglucosaminyl-diphospho-decaprenol L-rhamnosyltransferase